jgi:hypothetical protein
MDGHIRPSSFIKLATAGPILMMGLFVMKFMPLKTTPYSNFLISFVRSNNVADARTYEVGAPLPKCINHCNQ